MGRNVSRKQDLPAPIEMWMSAVGKDEMVQALEHTHDPRHGKLAKLLVDPRRPLTLVKACKEADVTLADFVEAFQKYQVHLGTVRLMRHIPQVMEDVGEDAKSRSEPCMRCDAWGYIKVGDDVVLQEEQPEWVPDGNRLCPQCHGRKEVRVPGDKLARELVFEAVGLTGKKAPAVAIQQNFSQPNTIEQASMATQKLLVKGGK